MAKQYKVEEANAGVCTCTIRGPKVQEIINENAKVGWIFEQFQTIVGRRCGCIPAPKLLIAFSKEI